MKPNYLHNFHYALRHLSVLLFCISTYSTAFAQSEDELVPRIRQYTLEDGLSQVSTNALIKDQNGIVWVGTQDGLNRFDGTEFVHYKYSDSDTNSIAGNLINTLLEDGHGNIWVGTIGNGLCYLDETRENFHQIALENSSDQNEIITSIVEDESGAIWIASRVSGLHELQLSVEGYYEQSQLLPEKPLGALLVDNKTLWVGAYEGELYSVSLEGDQKGQIETIASDMGHIQGLHNTDSHLLIGSDLGFFMYDHLTSEVEKIELEYSGIVETRHVLDFLLHDATSVWIATGNGLYLFDWKRKMVLQKIQNSEDGRGLSNNTVHKLLSLPNDKMLVGTANYLNLIDFQSTYFNTISKNKKGQHLLNDNVIFSIFKDEHGLWVGTSDGGLNLIQEDRVYQITEDENIPTSLSGSVVRAIVKDEINQRLWIATTRGLNLLELESFNPEHPKFRVFHHDPNNSNSINSDFIKDIALDHDNHLWGVTYGEGVFKMEEDDKGKFDFYRYKGEKEHPNSLVNNFAHCLSVDQNNDIWVGTQGGLSHFENSNSSDHSIVVNNYFRNTELENPLSHNSVYDILFDDSNQLWIATRHGLNLFLGDNKFKSWTEQDQFPNVVIYSIQDDNDDKLWLGTNDGLVRFDPDIEEFAHYTVADGIQSPEFDIHAKYRDDEGNVYMGGVAGLTYFNPRQLESIDITPELYFSKLKIRNNKDNSLDNLSQLTLHPMEDNMDLTFNYDQFPFYLEFSSVDFRLQKNIAYAYKLSPTDETWNILNDNSIQFLNLKSGEYNLQVNGFSRGKEWDQKPLEMSITIRSPWWATWWAYLAYVGLGLTAGYLFYRFSLSRKLAVAESMKLKELDTLKDRFYSNITHEFRTPLTVISGMADELEKNFNKEPHKKINLIKKNSQSLLALVNQMLDLSKLKAGKIASSVQQSDVISFLKYITESHQSFAKLKEVGLQFYSEEEGVIMDFDSYQLEQVLNNLIGNAVKYTNEYGSILVVAKKIRLNNRYELEVKVKDNGIGISEEQLPFIFDRFHQVDPIHGNQGSGIGLALVKELTGLMNGQVRVESELGEGTTFYLTFPITNTAQLGKAIIRKASEITPLLPYDHDVQDVDGIDHGLPILLIIEDNPDVTYYLQSSLEESYKIITAPNGRIGLDHAFDILPDIIISDVMMPEMDGFEVCEQLKKDERTNHIPVILLTAKATSEDKLAGLSHGADAYLIKPFKKEELMVRMENLMDIRQTLQTKYSSALLSSQLEVATPLTKEELFVKRLEEVILLHLEDEQFSIQHLSRELTLSRSQVHRKIKALTGMSTSIYIRHIRLQKSKELLSSTEKSISEIAYEVGFKTPSYFSQAYREAFGESPSATRNLLINS